MNTIKKILLGLLTGMVIFSSCEEDYPELGRKLDKSEIKYEVVQDFVTDAGGNTVILKNNTPGTVSMWDYGTGKSNRVIDTVRFAFKGQYVIKFSALTQGGVVEADSVIVDVTADNLNYVNDPLWTALSGGVGNEKTWLLDLDANGVSKFFTSPAYFAGEDYGWNNQCAVQGGICWTWKPQWSGNTWITPKGDYGTMTFSLKGGPFLTANHLMIPSRGAESGTYYLDVNTKELTFADATPLHTPAVEKDAASMYFTRVISLTKDAMQLAIHHKTKTEFWILNYISKEYSDNWVPPVVKDPNFNHGNQAQLLAVSSSKTWKLDLEVPYNWTGLSGNFLNNWKTRADIIKTGWAPYGNNDVQNIDEAAITFNANGTVEVKQDNGTTAKGTYKIDEKNNIITFSDITPSINIASWVTANTTAENTWKIVKVEKSPINDAVTGLWLGKRDTVKAEYMVFHFVR